MLLNQLFNHIYYRAMLPRGSHMQSPLKFWVSAKCMRGSLNNSHYKISTYMYCKGTSICNNIQIDSWIIGYIIDSVEMSY